jgi:hypothetical protein
LAKKRLPGRRVGEEAFGLTRQGSEKPIRSGIARSVSDEAISKLLIFLDPSLLPPLCSGVAMTRKGLFQHPVKRGREGAAQRARGVARSWHQIRRFRRKAMGAGGECGPAQPFVTSTTRIQLGRG